jgi:tRNA threonylcarbamoyladenosine biosynthesis protein TsaE
MSSVGQILDVISHSANCTRRLGFRLGRRLRGGDVVLLSGDLGAGKTTFTQGVAAGLGIDGPVNSPTFTLINEYAGHDQHRVPLHLFHIDLYRLGGAGVDTLGLDDYLGAPDGVALVEWPQVAPAAMTESALLVDIDTLSPTKRRIALSTHGPEAGRYQRYLDDLREELFGADAR